MGPSVKTVDRASQATPLAEDVLKVLQGQIAEGAFGQGASPLQRHAGTALEQYLSSIQGRVGSGQDSPQTAQLVTALTKNSETNANRQAADLREGYGITGNRFGSAGALGEGRLREDIASNLDQTIGGIRTNMAQFDSTQLLNAIGALQNMGNQNITPFLQLAQLGILPPEVIASPGIGSQLLSGGINALSSYVGGGGNFGFGGSSGPTGPTTSNLPGFTSPNFFPGYGQPSGLGKSGAAAGSFQIDPRLFN